MRRFSIAFATAALGVLATGCGDEGGGGGTGAASAIPPDPVLYLEADISGEGEQAENLDAILAKFGEVPLLGTPVEPRAIIEGALEDLGADNGVDISYAEDFEPWLGDSLAVGFSSLADADPGFVLSIDVDDEEIARDSVERISAADAAEETNEEYEGVSYQVSGTGEVAVGVFDDKFVLATVDEFEAAVDASRGESLASTGDASDALEMLGEDRLAALYVNTGAALDMAVAEGEAGEAEADAARAAVPEIFDQPLVASLGAGERTLQLDVAVGHSGELPVTAATDALGDAPEDSFAAVGVGGLGELVSTFLDRVAPIVEAEDESIDTAAIEKQFEAATGVSLDETLGSFGDAVAYGREIDKGLFFTLEVDVEGEGNAPTLLLGGLRDLAGEEEGITLGPPLGDGAEGFSAKLTTPDSGPTALYNAELAEDGLLFSFQSPLGDEPRPTTSGRLGDTELFRAAAGTLGEDYEMLAFADLGPILDSVFPDVSLDDIALGVADPADAIAGFLSDKLGFVAAGVRYDGDTAIQRTILGLG